MAGAGYKLFNTGDVLTAADVNTYLMQQTVMVFANAAARTTALSGVVAEGMLSYLKDTDAVEVYNGSSWVASDDPNAIQNTIVDAKGDLITATANDVPARLAVGSNGDTLLADSAATTGLRWQGNFAAGKNKIINGDFNINQRAFTSVTATGTYIFDRWFTRTGGDGTGTFTPQTFTAGTAPVSGYEGTNFVRIVTAGSTSTNTLMGLRQIIEDVRTFAGQTVTVSFWAKANSGTPSIVAPLSQLFGTGGSTTVTTASTKQAITTSWARYSFTMNVPSISGKTIGTGTVGLQLTIGLSAGSDFATDFTSLGIQNNTFDIWGVQVEAGSVATAFQTATGTLAGELAACQRYYNRISANGSYSKFGIGSAASTTVARIIFPVPVTLRTNPSSIEYSNVALTDFTNDFTTFSSVVLDGSSANNFTLAFTVASGLTQFRPYAIQANNNSSAYIAASAEL